MAKAGSNDSGTGAAESCGPGISRAETAAVFSICLAAPTGWTGSCQEAGNGDPCKRTACRPKKSGGKALLDRAEKNPPAALEERNGSDGKIEAEKENNIVCSGEPGAENTLKNEQAWSPRGEAFHDGAEGRATEKLGSGSNPLMQHLECLSARSRI